jgi:hypothetical protein
MGLGDSFSDAASILGDSLEWYALTSADDDGGMLDPATQRTIDDGRVIFVLLHAIRAQLNAFDNDLTPLIDAALAGDTQPLDNYCVTVGNEEHVGPQWPAIARATVTAIVALRRTFDALREELQPLFDEYLADHQQEQQQKYAEFKRMYPRLHNPDITPSAYSEVRNH